MIDTPVGMIDPLLKHDSTEEGWGTSLTERGKKQKVQFQSFNWFRLCIIIVPKTKKFQTRFNYSICETEPKLEIYAVDNYAYGYHSSLASVVSCTFGSNRFHLLPFIVRAFLDMFFIESI